MTLPEKQDACGVLNGDYSRRLSFLNVLLLHILLLVRDIFIAPYNTPLIQDILIAPHITPLTQDVYKDSNDQSIAANSIVHRILIKTAIAEQ